MVRIPSHRAPTHPGEILLREFLEPLGMTQYDAADKLGLSRVRLNQIIEARRGVTPDTALRLARLFGLQPQTWLSMQLAWDLYHAMHSEASREINKIRRLPELDRASACVSDEMLDTPRARSRRQGGGLRSHAHCAEHARGHQALRLALMT